MARIEIDPQHPDHIVIESEFREKDLVKTVPGSTWDTNARTWRVPLSWAACMALRGVFGPDLELGPALRAWAERDWAERVQPTLMLRTALEDPSLVEYEPALYPFQRAGVHFLVLAQQALIADEMGAGKTAQVIRAIAWLQQLHGNALPALIICPNTVKYTWKHELERWAPELEVVILDGGAAKRRKALTSLTAQVVIVNWEGLRLHTRLEGFGSMRLTDAEKAPKELNAIEWGTVVADEAHRAKEPKAKQTRALWGVSRSALYRFAMTGTPIANHPGELWSVMNFVAPREYPRKSAYVDRYCLSSWNAFGGMDIVGVRPDTAAEFHRFFDPRMIRRLKQVVLPQLPPKMYVTRTAEMKPKQEKAYRQMADTMLAQLEGDTIASTNPLAQMTRLSQFASSYAEVDEAGDVKLIGPSNKVEALLEILDEAGGEQVVVFAESRQLIELAGKALDEEKIPYGYITGVIQPFEREQVVQAFQAGRLRVILATLGAGGEGITLTAARVVVFLQRSWSMVKNRQAEDRVHRPGQVATSIEIVDVVAPDTIEEYRAERLIEKSDRLEEIVKDRETLIALLRHGG